VPVVVEIVEVEVQVNELCVDSLELVEVVVDGLVVEVLGDVLMELVEEANEVEGVVAADVTGLDDVVRLDVVLVVDGEDDGLPARRKYAPAPATTMITTTKMAKVTTAMPGLETCNYP